MPTDDLNERAAHIVRETTAKDPAAVSLGRRGGLRGGKIRMGKLSAEERTALGKKAAKTRWSVFRTQTEDGEWYWCCDFCGAVSPGSADEVGEPRSALGPHASWCELEEGANDGTAL